MPAEAVAVRRKHYPAWSGSQRDLRRLNDAIEQATRPLADAAVEEALAQVDGTPTDGTVSWLSDGARRDFEVTVEVRQRGNVEISGPIDDVLNDVDFDPRRVREVHVRSGRYGGAGGRVVFRTHTPGVELELRGKPAWVDSVALRLEREVRTRVPWWSWVRSYWFVGALFIPGLAIWTALGGFNIGDGEDQWTIGPAFTGLLSASMFWFVICGLTLEGIRRLVLPVEIVESSRESRGRVAMGVVGSFALSVVASWVAALSGVG